MENFGGIASFSSFWGGGSIRARINGKILLGAVRDHGDNEPSGPSVPHHGDAIIGDLAGLGGLLGRGPRLAEILYRPALHRRELQDRVPRARSEANDMDVKLVLRPAAGRIHDEHRVSLPDLLFCRGPREPPSAG